MGLQLGDWHRSGDWGGIKNRRMGCDCHAPSQMTAGSANKKARGTPRPNEGSFPFNKNKNKQTPGNKKGVWQMVEKWSRQEVVRVQERKKDRTCD